MRSLYVPCMFVFMPNIVLPKALKIELLKHLGSLAPFLPISLKDYVKLTIYDSDVLFPDVLLFPS